MQLSAQELTIISAAVGQAVAFIYGYGVLRTRVATLEKEMERRRSIEDEVLARLEQGNVMLGKLQVKMDNMDAKLDGHILADR